MSCITTLLVTRDPSVINQLQQLHDETDYARLEVCGRIEKVLPRLGRDAALLLVHPDAEVDPTRVRGVLGAADRSSVAAAVLSVPAAGTPAAPPDLGAYPTYQLPADLPALRELLANLHATSGRPRPATGPINPVDPVTSTLLRCDLIDDLPRIDRVAGQNTTVLLTGETGSGKSMLAKYLHASTPRRGSPYLVVDCGALSGQLIESEMFGHVRGAFTGADRDRPGKFAAAGAGTLVLDEINSLPLSLQAKLLRAVEERLFEPVGSNRSEPLRARLVAISNVPLEDEIRRDRFRADLYYRLNVVEFRLPPLRDRPAAVIPLAHQFLRDSATAACQGVTAFAPAALEAMLAYTWPGNVRELRNVVERAAALAAGPIVQLADLPDAIRGPISVPVGGPALRFPVAAEAPIVVGGGEDEAGRIVSVLRKHRNNRRAAAAELGMSRMSLYKKLHKYGLFTRKKAVAQVG